MAHGQAHFIEIKRRAPAFYYVKYELMETVIVGDEDKQIAALCRGKGLDPEDAYLHYLNDTEFEVAKKSIVIPGWGKGKAPDRKSARIRSFMGGWRYPLNWAGRCTQEYMRQRSIADVSQPTSSFRFDAIFIDEIGSPEVSRYIASLPEPRSGGYIAEFGGATKEQIVKDGAYLSALGSLFRTASEAVKSATAGKGILFLNVGSYAAPVQADLGSYADGLLTESLMREDASYAGIGDAHLWNLAKTLAGRGKIYIMTEGHVMAPTEHHYDSGNYRTPDERHRMYALASYWMAKQGNLTFFSQHQRWQELSSYWLKAQEYDIGQPKGDYSIWQEGAQPDGAGQRYRIYRRDYSKAIVLFRTRYDWNEGNFKDYSARSAIYDLSGDYRLLYSDGSLGPVLRRIGLSLGEGVVLVPAASSDPTH